MHHDLVRRVQPLQEDREVQPARAAARDRDPHTRTISFAPLWADQSPCSPASGPTCRSPKLAEKAGDWGFDGLELACWGDHFDVDAALADSGYIPKLKELLDRHDLQVWAIGNHLVGQAVCDNIDGRHQGVLPPDVWGDGDPEGVRQRAADKLKDTARAAAALGVTTVTGFTGSPIWHLRLQLPAQRLRARSSSATSSSPSASTRSSTSSTPRA